MKIKNDACTRGWAKEAYCGKMKKTRNCFFHNLHACQSWEWGMAAASKAVDQIYSTGTTETSPLILPAQCPACDSRDLNPSQSSQQSSWTPAEPGRWEGWGHPTAETAQVLKKGGCFHLEKYWSDQALLCAELQTLLSQVVHPGAVQKGWDAACYISTGRKQLCPEAERREGVHFSGLLKSTSADSSWMLPSKTFLPSLEGCPHSHAQGLYINLLKLQKCITVCPFLSKWWHHGTNSFDWKEPNKKPTRAHF